MHPGIMKPLDFDPETFGHVNDDADAGSLFIAVIEKITSEI